MLDPQTSIDLILLIIVLWIIGTWFWMLSINSG